MTKIEIDNNAFVYPMPMVLVGSVVGGKPNFMACAWVMRVNFKPVMIAVALGPHHTNKGIEQNKEFSINIPSVSLLPAVDYCGLVSGKSKDKSQIFKSFYGVLKHAPMIEECPLTMECTVLQDVKLPYDTIYIGEIVKAYSEEQYLTKGNPDVRKIQPFTLTMPDNSYWKVGDACGKAWSIGKGFKET